MLFSYAYLCIRSTMCGNWIRQGATDRPKERNKQKNNKENKSAADFCQVFQSIRMIFLCQVYCGSLCIFRCRFVGRYYVIFIISSFISPCYCYYYTAFLWLSFNGLYCCFIYFAKKKSFILFYYVIFMVDSFYKISIWYVYFMTLFLSLLFFVYFHLTNISSSRIIIALKNSISA